MADVKKVVLAYSGGLDTSVILKWLQDTYNCEVVTFTADLGQGEEVEPARAKAQAMGVKEIYIDDLREEFVRDFVFPMFRANTVYEGEYLLGTSIARPLIAKRLIEIANETGVRAVAMRFSVPATSVCKARKFSFDCNCGYASCNTSNRPMVPPKLLSASIICCLCSGVLSPASPCGA